MKLVYRGIEYDYTPSTVSSTVNDAVGKYRGLDIRFRNQPMKFIQLPTLDLVYRGAHTLHHA